MKKIYRWLFASFLLIAIAFNYLPKDLVNAQTNGLSSLQFDHVKITVPNYHEIIAWYKDKFGAIVEKQWTVDEFPDLQLSYPNINGVQNCWHYSANSRTR